MPIEQISRDDATMYVMGDNEKAYEASCKTNWVKHLSGRTFTYIIIFFSEKGKYSHYIIHKIFLKNNVDL